MRTVYLTVYRSNKPDKFEARITESREYSTKLSGNY